MNFSTLPQPVGLLKLVLNMFCTDIVKGRELCFIKYTNNFILGLGTCEPICFRLGMMIDTAKLYILNPPSVTLMLTHGHGVMGKLETVQSVCRKVA